MGKMKPGWLRRSEVEAEISRMIEQGLGSAILARLLELGMSPPLREHLVWTGDYMDDGRTKCYYQRGYTREWIPENWGEE